MLPKPGNGLHPTGIRLSCGNEISFGDRCLPDHRVSSRVWDDANGSRQALAAAYRPACVRGLVRSNWLPAQEIALTISAGMGASAK